MMRNTYTQTYAHHTRARAAIAHTNTQTNIFLKKLEIFVSAQQKTEKAKTNDTKTRNSK